MAYLILLNHAIIDVTCIYPLSVGFPQVNEINYECSIYIIIHILCKYLIFITKLNHHKKIGIVSSIVYKM